jgi:hypothetical protein
VTDLDQAIRATLDAWTGPPASINRPQEIRILPPSSPDRMRDAILAVLDLHGPDPDSLIGWWCPTCQETAVCPTVRVIAEKLGVEVTDG